MQNGFHAEHAPWNDVSRGAEHWISGPDAVAESLGMHNVISSGIKAEDEGLFVAQDQYWLEVMRDALTTEREIEATRANGAHRTPAATERKHRS